MALFRKNNTTEELVKETGLTEENKIVVNKTANELIQEIHDAFNNEVDILLKSSNEPLSTYSDKQELLNKSERLKSLGFNSSKPVNEANEEEKRIKNIKQINIQKEIVKEALNYFTTKYPLYKFITIDSIKNICAKYGLVYGTVDKYIGDIPDKNLKDIENFKIDYNDKGLFFSIVFYDPNNEHYSVNEQRYVDNGWYDFYNNEYMNKKFEDTKLNTKDIWNSSGVNHEIIKNPIIKLEKIKEYPLEIVATVDQFNMNKKELKEFEVVNSPVNNDPIVLCPVVYKKVKYYLIITAWGKEAEDDLVVNQKMN